MTRELRSFFQKAQRALDAANRTLEIDASTAANRAYYAAFYAVSALLLHKTKKSYKRHSAVEAAAYRDLVMNGTWPQQLGNDFRDLSRLRTTADYDHLHDITRKAAEGAVAKAEKILNAVAIELQAELEDEEASDPAQ
ncbi:MAG: HEPN domain-containing protein [Pirellulales bacterium]